MTEILKEHRGKAIASSLLILAPMLAGLLLWERLPGSMVIHWGADGNPDGYGAKAMAVFGMPLILLAGHWLCLLFTAADPMNLRQNKKAMGLVFWILPMLSLFVSAYLYAGALGRDVSMEAMTPAIIGIAFIVFGNYLPKMSRNRTLGIKLPWTLNNDENWNKTHRLGGKLWMIGGFVLLAAMLLPEKLFVTVLLVDLLAMILVPTLYSWLLARQQKKEGRYLPQWPFAGEKTGKKLTGLALTLGVLAVCLLLFFTGNIAVHMEEESFLIEASYWGDLRVMYDEIDAMELREQDEPGYRSNGFGSPRLSMGQFRNEEFGSYTRYTYAGEDCCIVLYKEGKALVLGGKNEAETRALYEALQEKMEK